MARFLCLLALVACGPSAAEIKQAREASYDATPQDVYKTAEDVTASSYTIAERMPDEYVFATQPVWYSDNGRESDGSAPEQRKAGNMQVSFVVLITPEGERRAKVLVTAKALDYTPGRPKPRELQDKQLPKWIVGRADKLQYAIHKRLASRPQAAGSASSTATGP
jgi:hypothetical protein